VLLVILWEKIQQEYTGTFVAWLELEQACRKRDFSAVAISGILLCLGQRRAGAGMRNSSNCAYLTTGHARDTLRSQVLDQHYDQGRQPQASHLTNHR
jgi:hypothetical protein